MQLAPTTAHSCGWRDKPSALPLHFGVPLPLLLSPSKIAHNRFPDLWMCQCATLPPPIVARTPPKREIKASAHFVAFSSSDNNVKTAVPLPQKLSYFCWCVFFFILHLCPCRLPSLDGAILFQLCPSLVCCVSCSCQWCNINYKLPFAFVVPSLLYLLVLAFCPPCVVQFN